MPANLTPEYHDAEQKYKEAVTPEEKLRALEEMLSTIPKHKGTEKMQADIKRRISRIRETIQKKSGGKRRSLYHIEREGAGQVVIIGPPNAGKSTLLSKLTRATPEIGAYPYTTHKLLPGMMTFENVKIQLVDTPAISEDFYETWIASIVRNADLVLLLIDLTSDDPVADMETIKKKLEPSRLHLRSIEAGGEILEDGTALNKTLIVANKKDEDPEGELYDLVRELCGEELPMIPISAEKGENLEELKRMVFESLGVIRIYTKIPGKEPDLKEPFILDKGATVLDAAEQIHKEIAQKLKFAKIWGSQKYDGQKVTRDYILVDGDVLELHA